jgi:cysteine-rich repeat protein
VRNILLPLFCLSLAPLSAFASGESIKVAELFPGTMLDPSAQYIMLRSAADEQGALAGQSVTIRDSYGTETTYTFNEDLSNGNSQARILLATPSAEAFFGIQADIEIDPVLDIYGGSVCFGTFDCVAWNWYYEGPLDNSSAYYDYLYQSQALTRDISRSGDAFLLELEDDTNDSSVDFVLAYPRPVNNIGASGIAPASTCGDFIVENLETCDDGNDLAGDGCDQCQAEIYYFDDFVCGNVCSVAPASSNIAWLPILGFLGLILFRRRQHQS